MASESDRELVERLGNTTTSHDRQRDRLEIWGVSEFSDWFRLLSIAEKGLAAEGLVESMEYIRQLYDDGDLHPIRSVAATALATYREAISPTFSDR